MTQIRVTGSPVAMQRTEGKTVKLATFIPLKIKKRGGRRVIVRPDSMAPTDTLKPIVQHDTPMQVALSKAFHWQRLLEQGLAKSGTVTLPPKNVLLSWWLTISSRRTQ